MRRITTTLVMLVSLSALFSAVPSVTYAGNLRDVCIKRALNEHPKWSYERAKSECKVRRSVKYRADPSDPASANGLAAAVDPHGVIAWRTGNLFWQFTTTVHYHWEWACTPAPPYGCLYIGAYTWVIDSIDCAKNYAYGYGLSLDACDAWQISELDKNGRTWLGYSVGANYTISILHINEGQQTRGFWWFVWPTLGDPPGGVNPYCCKSTNRWST